MSPHKKNEVNHNAPLFLEEDEDDLIFADELIISEKSCGDNEELDEFGIPYL